MATNGNDSISIKFSPLTSIFYFNSENNKIGTGKHSSLAVHDRKFTGEVVQQIPDTHDRFVPCSQY